jgi:hypothetical protein
MADQSISQLGVATALTGNELTVVVQNGVTKQTQVQDIADLNVIPPIPLNQIVISTSTSVPSNNNGVSLGPVTVASGATVTIAAGSRWQINT